MGEPVVIIGGGPGGIGCARELARAGERVVLVEGRDQVGGTCLNTGCIPTKTMSWAARTLRASRQLAARGVLSEPGAPHWGALARRVEEVVASLGQAAARELARAGVEIVRGWARVVGPGQVEVDGQKMMARAVVVAPGSVESYPPGMAPDGQWVVGAEELVRAGEIPEEVVIVGGGVIGCELASILGAVGVKVAVVEMAERLLPLEGLEPGVSRVVARELKKAGVRVVTGTKVERLEREKGIVRLEGGMQLPTGMVVVATGRRPREGWGEELVERDEAGGVLTDEAMATSLPGVYAVGDVLGPRRPMLAHLAEAEGKAAARAILGRMEPVDYNLVPGAVFSIPEVAWVGMSTLQARAAGLRAGAYELAVRAVARAHTDDELGGVCVMVLEEPTERLLGVQLVCAHATELIHACTLAVARGMKAAEFARIMAPHPTWAELLPLAAEGARS